MSFLSRWFGPKYEDVRLVSLAEAAVAEDPQTTNPTQLSVACKNGVMRLMGSVHNDREKSHIEGVVRGAIQHAGLKYQRIENQIETG